MSGLLFSQKEKKQIQSTCNRSTHFFSNIKLLYRTLPLKFPPRQQKKRQEDNKKKSDWNSFHGIYSFGQKIVFCLAKGLLLAYLGYEYRKRDILISFPVLICSNLYLQDLPKVPLPSLEETMAEYLRVLEPIVTSQQLEKTKALVKQFAGPNGLGPILQQYLEEKRDADDNWVNIQTFLIN